MELKQSKIIFFCFAFSMLVRDFFFVCSIRGEIEFCCFEMRATSIMNYASRQAIKNLNSCDSFFFALSPTNVVWIVEDIENFYDSLFFFV